MLEQYNYPSGEDYDQPYLLVETRPQQSLVDAMIVCPAESVAEAISEMALKHPWLWEHLEGVTDMMEQPITRQYFASGFSLAYKQLASQAEVSGLAIEPIEDGYIFPVHLFPYPGHDSTVKRLEQIEETNPVLSTVLYGVLYDDEDCSITDQDNFLTGAVWAHDLIQQGYLVKKMTDAYSQNTDRSSYRHPVAIADRIFMPGSPTNKELLRQMLAAYVQNDDSRPEPSLN